MRRNARRRPAQHGADAKCKLPRRERLRHVVVGAELEPDDSVDLVAACGDEDHGQIEVRSHPATELEAVRPRQHDVEDDKRQRLSFDQLSGRVAVACFERAVSLSLEIRHDDLPDDGLVVDNENRGHARH